MSENNTKNKAGKTFDTVRNILRHLFLHNGLLKAIAVAISIILWAGLISQDENITRDKTFQNVSVTVTGTETMKNNGFIVVSDLDEILKDISVVAAVPQKQYENADSSAYNIRIDLSKINGTGEQEVKLLSTYSPTYGRVTSINPSTITVQVEDYLVRPRIPVAYKINGDPPEGWYMSITSVDPSLVAVGGPKELMRTVFRALAFINTEDIDWEEGNVVNSYEISLYTRDGDKVDDSLITMTSSSLPIDNVLIEMSILPSEYFATEDLVQITGNVAEGYTIKNIKISPEVITVAARQEVLEQVTELSLDRNTVNVDGQKESIVMQLKVQKPSDDAIVSNDTVTVSVEIEPEET